MTDMILDEKYILNNGIEIPKLGLGTWLIDNSNVAQVVKDAVEIGYRHIDTAQAYKNESGVGEGIRNCSVPREDLFVTTKLSAKIKSHDEAIESIDRSLETLGFDYVDLMIIHSPKPWEEFQGDDHFFEGNREAWKALEEAHKAGKIRAIGLSNFEREDVENILSSCNVKPMVNQILAHIGNIPQKLIDYCKEQDILVEAYSPIGHGALLENEQLAAMAKKYDVSIPQLSIRCMLQLGLLPLPKSEDPDHMKTNAAVNFVISDDDMESLKDMKIKDYGEARKFPVFA